MLTIKDDVKSFRSSDYNYSFNMKTGFFIRWGKTLQDDPIMAPFPEILDLEISAGGDCLGKCTWCYKGNGVSKDPTYNMSFEDFKTIFHKINKGNTLTQIAFGIMNISTNPDFFKMMKYSREHNVIPNYTCHGLDVTDEYAKKTAELCGAVSVSLVGEESYNSIKKFIQHGCKQVNIHYVINLENYDTTFSIVDRIASDEELKKINAIVFLQYKPKGRNAGKFHSLTDPNKYKKLIKYCQEKGVGVGFDSCSAHIYSQTLDENEKINNVFAEPCESKIFSFYTNCKGVGYACSFVEGVEEGIDVLHCNDFFDDVWNNPISKEWREKLLKNERKCPIYNLNS